MSITNEKLQTIKDNVSKVYHSGQIDVIKNANSLKGFESSKAMLLDDVSPVEHEMGVKVRGKNLVDDTKRLFTGGNIFFGFTQSSGIIPIKLSKGTYTFSVVTTDGTTTNLYIKNSDNTKTLFTAYSGNKLTFTLSETQDILLNVYKSEYTSTDDVVTAQIELGTTATTYEPYNNDIQNVYSKNLIPFPYINSTQIINGVTFTVNSDGTITANGTAEVDGTGINAYLEITSISTFYIPKGDYILSGCPSGGSSTTYSLTAVNGSGISYTKFRQDIGNGITLSSSGEYWIIRCQVMAGQTVENLTFKPQLELGSTATYYEKYHEPYPLVIKELGKNLFNINVHTTSNSCYKDGIFSGTNKPGRKEYIYMDITDIWKIAYNSKLPITCSFDMKTEIDGEISVYTLGEYRMAFNSGSLLKLNSTTDWQHFDVTFTKTAFTTGTTGDHCNLSFYSIYGSGVIPSVKNLQIYLGDTIISEYEDYITPKEYTPTTDGVINGVKNLYPNTTLISNGDRIYIDCNYYKDIDKAYNKLSAEIALSGGE